MIIYILNSFHISSYFVETNFIRVYYYDTKGKMKNIEDKIGILKIRFMFRLRSQVFCSYCYILCCFLLSFLENNIDTKRVHGFGYYSSYAKTSAKSKELQSTVFHTIQSHSSYQYQIKRQSMISSLVFSSKTDSLSTTTLSTTSVLPNYHENEKSFTLPILAATSSIRQKQRIKWIIVGGGIHGVHVAVRLISEGIVQKLSPSSSSSQKQEEEQQRQHQQRQQRNNNLPSN